MLKLLTTTLLILLASCSSVPDKELTAEEILSGAVPSRAPCLKIEQLPACPRGSIKVVEYGTGKCVWRWGCTPRYQF